jgi:hypothetical protein
MVFSFWRWFSEEIGNSPQFSRLYYQILELKMPFLIESDISSLDLIVCCHFGGRKRVNELQRKVIGQAMSNASHFSLQILELALLTCKA